MNNEEQLRECLSRNLGDLVERMILGAPPFHDLPEKFQYHNFYLDRCKRHKDKIDEKKKEELLRAVIWRNKYEIISAVVGPKYCDRYNRKYGKICDDFFQWVREVEEFKKLDVEDEEKLPIAKIVKHEFKEMLNEFVYNKKYSTPGMIAYSQTVLDQYEFILSLDKGTYRSFFEVRVGFDYPKFLMFWHVFGGDAFSLKHNNSCNLKKSLTKIAEYMKFLMPHFEQALKDSLDEVNGIRPKREFEFG